MSEALDTIRQYLPALSRNPISAGAEFWDPDITWRAIEGAPDDVGVMRGPDALASYYRQWTDTFADIRMDPLEDPIAVGDKVVVTSRVVAKMKGSDGVIDMIVAIVFVVRNGKIVSGREYATRDEALAAAGRAA